MTIKIPFKSFFYHLVFFFCLHESKGQFMEQSYGFRRFWISEVHRQKFKYSTIRNVPCLEYSIYHWKFLNQVALLICLKTVLRLGCVDISSSFLSVLPEFSVGEHSQVYWFHLAEELQRLTDYSTMICVSIESGFDWGCFHRLSSKALLNEGNFATRYPFIFQILKSSK